MQSARTALSMAIKVYQRSRCISWTKTAAGSPGLNATLGMSPVRPRDMEKNNCLHHFNTSRASWSDKGVSTAITAGALFTAGIYGFQKTKKATSEKEETCADKELKGLEQILSERKTHPGIEMRQVDVPRDEPACSASEKDAEPDKKTTGGKSADDPTGEPEVAPGCLEPAAGRPKTTTAQTDVVPLRTASDSKAQQSDAKEVLGPMMKTKKGSPIFIHRYYDHELLPPGDRWHVKVDVTSPENMQVNLWLKIVLILGLLLRRVKLLPGRYGAYTRGVNGVVKVGECQKVFGKPPQRDGPMFRGKG
ncbi:Hypp3710 [Branchiostoma lanceolatum]|uniref:Hypp3710 protein n=1 Tax=Branchiostoma lanceolatum TaxID=7740 RepID=A0A8K0A1I8_BRALA|nr:Hypp3710 [Branchiostoma lanceolatum]